MTKQGKLAGTSKFLIIERSRTVLVIFSQGRVKCNSLGPATGRLGKFPLKTDHVGDKWELMTKQGKIISKGITIRHARTVRVILGEACNNGNSMVHECGTIGNDCPKQQMWGLYSPFIPILSFLVRSGPTATV